MSCVIYTYISFPDCSQDFLQPTISTVLFTMFLYHVPGSEMYPEMQVAIACSCCDIPDLISPKPIS